MKRLPPATASVTDTQAAIAHRRLEIDMVLRAPAAKWLTSDDTIPAPSDPSNVTAVAASIRGKHSRVGTAADAASFVSSPASAAPEMTRPCLVRRLASKARPRARRLATVPAGQSSVWAASLIDRPSSSHSTTGARYLSGNRLSSRSSKSDRKSTRLNSSHLGISYAVFCLKNKKN